MFIAHIMLGKERVTAFKMSVVNAQENTGTNTSVCPRNLRCSCIMLSTTLFTSNHVLNPKEIVF